MRNGKLVKESALRYLLNISNERSLLLSLLLSLSSFILMLIVFLSYSDLMLKILTDISPANLLTSSNVEIKDYVEYCSCSRNVSYILFLGCQVGSYEHHQVWLFQNFVLNSINQF